MSENVPDIPFESDVHYCAVHAERDTELRCNRCERYMCIDCAKRTPVGYTCRQCVRGHENKFFEGTTFDYAIVAVLSMIGGAIIAFVTSLVGGILLLGIVIAPALGGTTAQIALQMTGRRRGRYSGYVVRGGCAGRWRRRRATCVWFGHLHSIIYGAGRLYRIRSIQGVHLKTDDILTAPLC